MKSKIKKSQGFSITNTLIILGLIILVAGTYYYISKKNNLNDLGAIIQTEEPQVPNTQEQKPDANEQNPNAQQSEATNSQKSELITPLPSLNDSDPIALDAIEQVSFYSADTSLLIQQEMIRNFVVFIDNLSKGDIIAYFSPVNSPKKSFSVIRSEQKIYLNTESYLRYDVYADLIDSIDIETTLEQYRHLKPLINEAYREIGYADEGFLNKLNQSIDLITNAPIINYSIELIAPSVMYKFADPQLESLNDVEKLLIRMGPSNTFKIQKKLKQLQLSLQTLLL
jgi:hypothetical protein